MNQKTITLISFGNFEKVFLEKVADAVKQEFFLKVNVREGHIDLSEFYDPGRRQYNGNELLRKVDAISPPDSLKTLGLFNVDLFIPILTFIFGQAFLNGNTGIASVHRLSNERYGLKPDETFLINRTKKEVIHELGHTFGLFHCHHPNCVMQSSTYVENIDQKRQNLCPGCREGLRIL